MSAPTRALAARIVALAGICLLLTSAAAAAVDGHITGWITEPGVDPPSYAVTEPIDSNVNVDTVLLLCTERGRDRFLELDLYPSTEGPLLPDGADPQALKDAPAVQISIDGALFPAQLLFADDYVLVANSPPHTPPSLSAPLLDAMERGRQVAPDLSSPQAQDHIALLTEEPVPHDCVGPPARFAILQADHQARIMLHKIQGEGAEWRFAAKAIAFHFPEPRPEAVLQRGPCAQWRFALHYRI